MANHKLIPPELASGWIQTYTCNKFYPIDPSLKSISIQDIAHALSFTCRFGGHAKVFYTVAQHCIIMARWFRTRGRIEEARWALLHDAAEAYVLDMPTPIKYLPQMVAYRDIEKSIEHVIFKKFGLFGDKPPTIKELDRRILVAEAKVVLAPIHKDWMTPEQLKMDTSDLIIKPYRRIMDAEKYYLKEFNTLFS